MVISPYSSNVILAKARAMYGHSLKAKDFQNLVNCHSVGEIASYLKNNTSYASALKDINESTIHRGHLEQLLRRKLLADYAALGRYDITVGTKMWRYLIEREEIEQIVICLRLMNAGRSSEFLFSLPLAFAVHTHLDMVRMSRCRSYDELLTVMQGTAYYDILAHFAPEKEQIIPLTDIETALYSHMVGTMFDIIDSNAKPVREELTKLYGLRVDVQNVTRILRLKRYFHASPDVIRANLLPGGRCLSPNLLNSMIHSPDAEAVMAIFRSTSAGRRLADLQQMPELGINHLPYYSARKLIHLSVHAPVVLLSYIFIKEVELENIIEVIESIRYGLQPDEIKTMLVLLNE